MMQNPKKKLLFVDDQRNILDMLSRMLGKCGEDWEGEFFLSVDEALEALHRTKFDTVVADIRMPKKDGFALIEAMRADDSLRNIPIIVLTSEGDKAFKRRVLDMGATDLLNKPVSSEDLIARLRNALRLKEYEDRLNNQVTILDGLVWERTKQLEQSYREVVWRLAKAGEFRDDQTGNHVARVAWCSCLLAEGMGMEPKFTELLFQTSPLHDIGKMGILLLQRRVSEHDSSWHLPFWRRALLCPVASTTGATRNAIVPRWNASFRPSRLSSRVARTERAHDS